MTDSLKDKIYNKYLFLKNWILKKILNKKFGYFKINLEKYELIKYDEFNKHDIEFWSPNYYYNCHEYIAPECVKFSNNGLLLEQNNNHVGQISTLNPLSFGIYEFNIELPIGTLLNPKINLINNNANLPKITIFNAESDKNGNYLNNIITNIYYGFYGLNNKETGKLKTLYYSEDELKSYYINIKFIFSKTKLVFYLNNYKVRVLTNKKIMKYFKNHDFKLEITNSILKNSTNKNSLFRIKNFSHYILK